MTIGERTNPDNIKLALVTREGQCYLLVTPPAKLRFRGWVPFERGPFLAEDLSLILDEQGPVIQYMVCELLDCTSVELDSKPAHIFTDAVDLTLFGLPGAMRATL
jgi:hypothetical protein